MGSCTSSPVQLRQGLDDPNKERVNRFYRWRELTQQTRRRVLKRRVVRRKGAAEQLSQWQGTDHNNNDNNEEEEESEWDLPDTGYYTPVSLAISPDWNSIHHDLLVLDDRPAPAGPLPDEVQHEQNLRPTRRVVKKKKSPQNKDDQKSTQQPA